MTTTLSQTLMRRHIALTNEHGSWVLLLSPLVIGLYAGGTFSSASLVLVLASLSAFLIRQPITVAVKIYSGRRSQRDLPAALFWIGVYGSIGLVMVVALILQGFGYLLYLAIPGIPIFLWQLYLVSRRSERRQMGVEVVGSGVLALIAPAAMWVGQGQPGVEGVLLWLLVWFQSAASIVYAYLRLAQRELKKLPDLNTRLAMGRRPLAYTTFNFLAVLILALVGVLPSLLFLPYGLQWAETIYGTLNPAIGVRPNRIGIRQLIVSSLFTLLFLLTLNS